MIVALPVAVAGFVLTDQPRFAFGILVGCAVVGQIITPDLDQEEVTRSEWEVIKRTGPLGWFWVALWWLYARAIPHRHWLSHAPVIGTVLRWLYLSLPVLAAFALLSHDVAGVLLTTGQTLLNPVLVGVLVGNGVADAVHWLMDVV